MTGTGQAVTYRELEARRPRASASSRKRLASGFNVWLRST
jgi:hypothetical protein